MTEQCLVE